MRPWDKKYYSCQYCGNGTWSGHDNTHRVYIRSKDKDRKFIAIAWYCTKCKLFSLDEIINNNPERKYRLEHNMKPEDNYMEWLGKDLKRIGIAIQ